MAKHELSLAKAASGPALEESQSTHDDLMIPPADEAISDHLWPDQEADAPRPPTAKHWLWGLALGGAAIIAGLWLQQGGAEQRHENWQHVAAASNASTDFAHQLIRFDGAGDVQTVRSLTVTGADRNLRATQELRSALRRNDLVTATTTLQACHYPHLYRLNHTGDAECVKLIVHFLESSPNGLPARFTVTGATKESTKHGYLAKETVHGDFGDLGFGAEYLQTSQPT